LSIGGIILTGQNLSIRRKTSPRATWFITIHTVLSENRPGLPLWDICD